MTPAEIANDFISYGGKLMRYADRPAENFVRPWTLRLNTTHTFNISRTKWLWNNFFRFRSGYNSIISDFNKDSFVINGVLREVDTFRSFRVPYSFSWDMRLGFEIDAYKGNTLYVNVDIYNVLDTKNIALVSLIDAGVGTGMVTTPIYELGRQFWVQVGYKF